MALTGAIGIAFLLPSWRHLDDFPVADLDSEDPRLAYLDGPAAAWLPHETTQRHLRALGSDDAVHNGLWTRFLNGTIEPSGDGWDWLRVDGPGEIVIGSTEPLHELFVEHRGGAQPLTISHRGHSVRLEPGESATLALGRIDSIHSMWWPSARLERLRVLQVAPQDASAVPSEIRLRPSGPRSETAAKSSR
jgi:hypothetical protein